MDTPATTRSPRPFLLRGLLFAALMALWCLGGCVIPSDIHERRDALDAPTLDRSKVVPSPDRIVELTSTVTEFSVAAALSADEDIMDGLYFQWYVGYPESEVPLPPAFESWKTIQFNACAFKDVLGPVGSTHTIELVISQEPADFQAATGRVLPVDYIYVSWQVRLKVDCE